MEYTTNYNLKKPEGTDVYDIGNENDNMDIIDTALAKAPSTDDSASTDLADGDYIPFFDTSANEKKKSLWSNIVAKLKNTFSMGSNLAPIANGPKYPATWSAGKQFVYQGQLCKTKVNVTTADDITVGSSGNAQLDSDITSQINSLNTTGVSIIKENSTITTTNGTIVTFILNFTKNNKGDVTFISYFDLRMSDLTANTIPVLTIKNSALTSLLGFTITFPPGIRGSGNTLTVTDGGYFVHDANSDTMSVVFFNYITSQPAGYLHVSK